MPETLYGGVQNRRVTIRDLQRATDAHERWAMLTAYDYSTARVFDEAGVPVLLVGDSAANVIYGYDTTLPVTVDELLPLVRGVVRGTKRAMVVADMPFGSYQASPTQALENRGALHEGRRRSGGEARRRPPCAAAGRGTGERRRAGHGSPRPDSAVGERVRGLPGAGSRRGGRAPPSAGRKGDATRRGIRGGARSRAV